MIIVCTTRKCCFFRREPFLWLINTVILSVMVHFSLLLTGKWQYMLKWSLRTLGTEELRWRGRPIAGLPDIFWTIVGLLLTAPHQRLCRSRLAGLLWPDSSERAARHCLASALWRIKGRLPEPDELILGQGDDIALSLEFGWIDTLSFARRASRAISEPHRLLCARERNKLASTLKIYHGDFLIDRDAETIAIERERLRSLFLDGLTDLANAEANAARWGHARRAAKRLCEVEPFREDAQRLLMIAHAECGNPGLALEQYRKLEEVLRHELGISATSETQRLARSLAGQTEHATPATLPLSQRELLVQAREQLALSLALLDATLSS